MNDKIKKILSKYKTIAMVGVSKDDKETLNYSYEIYAEVWL